MGEVGQLFSTTWGTLGFGGVAGAAVGYTAKKLTKLAAIAVGVVFILIQVLAYMDFIEVHWETVQKTAESAWMGAGGVTLADRAWAVINANLPFGAGFVAGFVLGFKLG